MKPKNLAILTIVVGERSEKIFEKTKPSMEFYADKIGADLIVMKECPETIPSPHWLKFSIYDWLHKKYNRLIYLDCDLIIRDDCPDLFEIVPENKIGLYNEGNFTPRSLALYEVKVKYRIKLPAWDHVSYFNTGVMVISRDQRHIFRPVDDYVKLRYAFGEQTYLNYRIFSSEILVHELRYQFNRMSLMNKWLGVSRLDSYIVHYAGVSDTDLILRTIDQDLQDWQKDKPKYHYEPFFYITVSGGLGDQVCAEPALRYLSETLYPRGEIYVITAFPELFWHLKNIHAVDKMPELYKPAIFEIDTHPTRDTPMRKYISHFFTHPVDYSSLAILKRILPNDKKRIDLRVSQKDIDEVADYNVDILIHPGKGWKIKTFPVEWWDKVIRGIVPDLNLRVAIIGKHISDAHSYQAVNILPGILDLRDKLSLGSLLAMIQKTPLLLSNDSAPIHLAGAFDNHIFLIPTCQHPDHLLPYRYGTQSFKTHSLYKKLLDDEIPMKPNVIDWATSTYNGNVLDFLPNPEDVIEKIGSIFKSERIGIKPSVHYSASRSAISMPI